MTPKEQEIAINELEERVDRLRNIYEQYFLGFEKLEPTVPKKDVDRRFALLRKEQIRNTAMRFRFQVVTQKYNTYSMHWVRICRQIEEGTYKRHIRKAKARFGDGAGGANERALASDVSIDIEIDLDDFENDAPMAAFADTPDADANDTLPPPAAAPPPSGRMTASERTPRGAALPAGMQRKVLRKRDDTEAPPGSVRPQPAAAPATASPRGGPHVPAAAPPGMEQPQRPRIALRAQGGPGTAAAGSVGTTRAAAPASGARMPVAPAASGARIPVAPAASDARLPVAPAASTPRAPVAPAASTPRIPVAPAASAPRMPVAPAASGPRLPVAPAASGPRLPVASGPRLPIASTPGAAAPPNRLPPPPPAPSDRGSSPDLAQPQARPRPAAPASAGRLPAPQTRPGPRPPTPSVTEQDDHDTLPPAPDSHSGARTRLPLPSQQGQQHGKPKKE